MLGHISRTLRRPRDNHAAVMPARMPPRLNPRPSPSAVVPPASRTGRCTSDAPPRFFACSPPFPQVFATWRPDDRRSCAAAWPSGGLAPNPPGGAAGKASPSRSPGTPFGRDRTRRLYCPRLRGDVCTAGQDRRERAERCPRRRGSRRRPRIPRSRAPGPGALNDLGITPRLCRSPVDNPIRGPPELQPSGTGSPPRRSRAPSSAGCPRRFPNYSRDARGVVANGSPTP